VVASRSHREVPMNPIRTGLSLLVLASLSVACSDVDNSIDCNAICDRYRDCFDRSYSTSACYSRCQARGTSNAEDRRVVDTCAACINGLSCTGAAFTCGVQCSSIVP
jgi:hypothetical protein